MSRTLLFTVLISVATHAAIALYEESGESQNTLAMGSIKAPVSLTFSTVNIPTPLPAVEPIKETPRPVEKRPLEKKPEPKREVVKIAKPKPQPKPVEKTQPVVEKKTEPKKQQEVQPPAEQQVVKSALKETEVESASNEPVFIEKPAIRNAFPPNYPRIAQRRNLQGVVMLEVIIDTKGNAMNIRIIQSSGHNVLDKSAITAVEGWEFEPQKRNNQLVASRVHIPVAFRLN